MPDRRQAPVFDSIINVISDADAGQWVFTLSDEGNIGNLVPLLNFQDSDKSLALWERKFSFCLDPNSAG